MLEVMKETMNGFPPPVSGAADLYETAKKVLEEKSETAREILRMLEGSDEIFYVLPTESCLPMFVTKEKAGEKGLDGGVIAWHPTATSKAATGEQSPAVCLAHELGHAVQWLTKHEWYMSTSKSALEGNESAKREIENDNITKYETPVAEQLGEGTRKTYD